MIVNEQDKNEEWLKFNSDGEFVCRECENTGKPLMNTINGMVEADYDDIKKQLSDFPTKIIYAVCPVCGMEYIFRLASGELYLEASEEEK